VISDLQPAEKVAFAVGAIVLRCQEIERLLKFVVPFTSGGSPTWPEIFARLDDLARNTLGEIAGKFVDTTSGDVEAFKVYVKELVNRRNDVVHHFGTKYGARLAAGRHGEVLAELRQLYRDTAALLQALREMTADIMEATRDTLYVGTDDYEGFAAMCSDMRAAAERDR